jgi:hypothetical protein
MEAYLRTKHTCLVVGEVRIYNSKTLVHKHTLPSVATALWFGQYGREENTLITVGSFFHGVHVKVDSQARFGFKIIQG